MFFFPFLENRRLDMFIYLHLSNERIIERRIRSCKSIPYISIDLHSSQTEKRDNDVVNFLFIFFLNKRGSKSIESKKREIYSTCRII